MIKIVEMIEIFYVCVLFFCFLIKKTLVIVIVLSLSDIRFLPKTKHNYALSIIQYVHCYILFCFQVNLYIHCIPSTNLFRFRYELLRYININTIKRYI